MMQIKIPQTKVASSYLTSLLLCAQRRHRKSKYVHLVMKGEISFFYFVIFTFLCAYICVVHFSMKLLYFHVHWKNRLHIYYLSYLCKIHNGSSTHQRTERMVRQRIIKMLCVVCIHFPAMLL